jgi:predicted ATP-grasp superfamily ATP-dependent carboligase
VKKIYQNAKAMPTMEGHSGASELTVVAASGRWMVQSLFRAGMVASCCDLFSDRDVPMTCQQIRVDNLDCAPQRVSHPSALIFGGGFESHLTAFAPLWGPRRVFNFTMEQVAFVRSVDGMKAIAGAAGVSFPKAVLAVEPFCEAPPHMRWLIKPSHGTAGAGIRFLAGGAQPRAGELIQEFIEGRAMSGSFLATAGQGCQLLGVCNQLTGVREFGATSPFQFCGAVGPVELDTAGLNAVRRMGEEVQRLTGCRGLFGIDFILARTGEIFLLEINPRPTSSMEVIERALGISLMGLHVQAFVQREVNMDGARTFADRVFGKAIRFHSGRRVHFVKRRESAQWMRGSRQQRLADIPAAGTRIIAGQPVFTVLAAGSDEAEVLGRLRRRMMAFPSIRR